MSAGGDASGPRRDRDGNDEQTFADVLNAFSFGTPRRRRKTSGDPGTPQDTAHDEKEEPSPAPAPEWIGQAPPVDDAPAAWQPGHSGQPGPWQPGHAEPGAWESGTPQPDTWQSGHAEQPDTWQPGHAEPDAPAAAVRAYVWTGGRTRSRHHFEIETLVSAAVASSGTVTQPHRTVLELCREPRSVAEVAALLSMPLGVAMVLLGDMTEDGLIVVHEAATVDGGGPTAVLMERVLTGLRQL